MHQSAKNRWTSRRRAPARAFTILELLVVLAILTLLAGILVPAVQSLITAQRVDQAQELMSRMVEGILNRARFLAKSREFAYGMLILRPYGDGIGSEGPGPHQWLLANYFPYDVQSGGVVFHNLNKLDKSLTFQTPDLTKVFDGGGPYIGTAVSSSGASAGPNELSKDPWSCPFYLGAENNSVCGLAFEGTFLWNRQMLMSSGPDRLFGPEGDDLYLNIHLYRILADETLQRLEVVNRAIREYNRQNLPNNPLPPVFWDRYENPTGDTAYEKLVEGGYLEKPKIDFDGVSPDEEVDFYAIDAWGFMFRLDTEYGPNGLQATTGPPMRAFSGNLMEPGTYCGKGP